MNTHPLLVTGATDGIGFETALGLLRAGRTVFVHGRTLEKARGAAARLEALVPGARVRPVHADFGRLDEVRDLGRRFLAGGEPLGGVVHNAGALFRQRELTEDGWEATWQVNHLAPFLLHHHLAVLLTAGSRVVWVSSALHTRGRIDWDDLNGDGRVRARSWDGTEAYCASKLANALTAFRIGRTHPRSSLSSFALHPGAVGTKMLRDGFGMEGISPAEGARTSLFACLDPTLDRKTGLYLDARKEGPASAAARDEDLQDRLWDWTGKSLGL